MSVWTLPSRSPAVPARLTASLALLGVLAIATVALPMFLVDVVPMMDYPAHLTRLTLLSRGSLDPLVARAYVVDFSLAPNLAIDLIVPRLAPWIGVGAALKLFMTMGLALWVAGAALIHRGLWREYSAPSLLAVFFAANPSFYFGFANFHFGAGAALTLTGLWLCAQRRGPLEIAGMAAAAMALLFCHLMALAIFALLMGGFELGRWRETREGAARGLATLVAIFAPALLVWALAFEHARSSGLEFHWLQNALGLLIFSSGAGAIRGNMYPLAGFIALLLLASRLGRVTFARRAAPVLALATLAMLLSPAVAMSGALIQIRMPSVVCVLALAAFRIELPARLGALAVAAIMAGAATAGEIEALRWRADSTTITAMREAARQYVTPGARVATALTKDNGSMLGHAGELTILDESAFAPTFFATKGQSTFMVRAAYRDIAAQDAIEGAIPTLAELTPLLGLQPPTPARALRPYGDIACAFDYLFVVGAGVRETPPALVPLVERADFALYRIVSPRPCAPR